MLLVLLTLLYAARPANLILTDEFLKTEGFPMLKIINITKKYITGDFIQSALDDVSLAFRKSEFVAILGPSGSGKTTLLNIIGGLDRYDSGDLSISGISTREYTERDWDAYRNHRIGFVFQNYNLIPHQTILANVELALAISGMSSDLRKEKAKAALGEVGLIQHIHKRPNQLSGGQMQRVAIARALVNDPDILLADEPTGAIDTETSLQIMALLKEVARDRLVIMVTHNAELAEQYATRTVQLKDGKVLADSYPLEESESGFQKIEEHPPQRAAMNRLTSLSLSFSNLMTKKGRTLLTAFAGSIGIIGIALILALSNGVKTYVSDIQRDTMVSYPITIDARTFDFTAIVEEGPSTMTVPETEQKPDAVYADISSLEMANEIRSTLTENNLSGFKKYLDSPENAISPHLGPNGIIYSYDPVFSLFTEDTEGRLKNVSGNSYSNDDPDGGSVEREVRRSVQDSLRQLSSLAPGAGGAGPDLFQELLPGQGGSPVSQVTMDNYELAAGAWPSAYDEVLLVLDQNQEISIEDLDSLGILPTGDLDEMMDALDEGSTVPTISYRWEYQEILGKELYLLPISLQYLEMDDGTFELAEGSSQEELVRKDALTLTISGIVYPAEDAAIQDINGVIGYTSLLTDQIIDRTDQSPVVKAQLSDQKVNVISGLPFLPEGTVLDPEQITETIQSLSNADKAELMKNIASNTESGFGLSPEFLQGMDDESLAELADQFLTTSGQTMLPDLFEDFLAQGSFEENMTAFGYVDRDMPSAILIYPDSFESKEAISSAISDYNAGKPEQDRIMYTDLVALMTTSITDIIGVITYVLIAFVAVSLIVSSIMIGIITYISVVERTKEIGILRALGASRANIAEVFNAETFVIGSFSGILGVGISYLLTFPINRLIHVLTGNTGVHASLPLVSALVLIILSILLTLLGGLIPSRKAARKDPVAALRTE